MADLASTALIVAKMLHRATTDGTAILDLETEIKEEIGNAIRHYNRTPIHLTEVRGGELTTAASTTWYSEVDITNGGADQAIAGRSTLNVNDIISIHYMRENPGASGLNEPMSQISYTHFESLFEGSTPQGQPEYFTRYAGSIGIWPTPSGVNTLYWSGVVKPVVPTSDVDESVWFDQANEMIEAAAASRVAAKYLKDDKEAAKFKAIELSQENQLLREYTSKASTGRLKAHD